MTLEEATHNLMAALRDHDLDAVAAALADRAACIKAGSRPTSELIAAGNRAIYDLLTLKQRLAFENARLNQIRESLTDTLSGLKQPHFDYCG
ncbi:MAG: hypothetical protein JO307_15500 [Bryobacterales bacterium]|nr:hypothetical protein [Bryobacterales bacterium]MBV9401603.1 hypothetical protein [Bryobacterales bacterium]